VKDCYDFSKLKNVRRNPYADYLNENGHTTIIQTSPKDYDDEIDVIFDEDLKKEAI